MRKAVGRRTPEEIKTMRRAGRVVAEMHDRLADMSGGDSDRHMQEARRHRHAAGIDRAEAQWDEHLADAWRGDAVDGESGPGPSGGAEGI